MKNEEVQKDLQLNGLQKEQIARLNGNWDQQLQKHFEHRRELPLEEGRQEFLKLARENEQALGEILDSRQLRRLGQITLQFKGPRVFLEPDVVRKLNRHHRTRATRFLRDGTGQGILWEPIEGVPGPTPARPRADFGQPKK